MSHIVRVSREPRQETVDNGCDISSDFTNLRVSALWKACRISSSVDKVTIGPNSSIEDESLWSEGRKNDENSSKADGTKNGSQLSTENSFLSTRSSIEFSKKKILLENEKLRRENVRKAMEKRKQDMERSTKDLQEELETMRQILGMKREQEEAEELARREAEEEELAQQYEIRKKHEQQLLAQRIQERNEKLERAKEEEHRKSKERQELANRVNPLRTHFRDKCRDIGNISKACKDRNSAAAVLAPLANRLKELGLQMEAVNERMRSGDITIADINIAESVVQQSEDILNVYKGEIARIDVLWDEEIARREYEVRQAEAQMQADASRLAGPNSAGQIQLPQAAESPPDGAAVQSAGQHPAALPVTPPNEPNVNNNPESVASATDSSSVETAADENDGVGGGGFSDYESLQMYMNTHVFLTNYAANYRDLTQATSMKKFRFECQKAINIPVNGISGVNASHLKDKYRTLRSLLMGKSSPNVTQHPQGIAFCKDVLAKKIVSQGETLISSKPEMAFPVAAVALAVWNDFPDFGELLLAHFRRTCPYILPVFLPRLQGQTNEEYYKSLGYKYTEDGVVEKQDKYLTRMSGLMRLYASIIVSKQRKGLDTQHPHGIQNAWRWLAVTLNVESRADLSDVCATLILDMLEVAGNSLWQAYPKQFPKMLIVLVTQYYPQMQNEAGIGGGPMARLENFLKDCITNRTIPPPKGELAPNFW